VLVVRWLVPSRVAHQRGGSVRQGLADPIAEGNRLPEDSWEGAGGKRWDGTMMNPIWSIVEPGLLAPGAAEPAATGNTGPVPP